MDENIDSMMIHELCFRYRDGKCLFFVNDPYSCNSVCWNFISFNKGLIKELGLGRSHTNVRFFDLIAKMPSFENLIPTEDCAQLNLSEDIEKGLDVEVGGLKLTHTDASVFTGFAIMKKPSADSNEKKSDDEKKKPFGQQGLW